MTSPFNVTAEGGAGRVARPRSGWDIAPEPATKAQRRSLYRHGFARWLVKRMDKEQAALALTFATEHLLNCYGRKGEQDGTAEDKVYDA